MRLAFLQRGGAQPRNIPWSIRGCIACYDNCRIVQLIKSVTSWAPRRRRVAADHVRCGTWAVTTPLHQMKAEFFKTLGHPLRIRVLELLSAGEQSVGELLRTTEIEASNLSQQLAVLRRAGLVTTRKEGSTVYYSLVSTQIADLMVARSILTSVLSEQTELLTTLRADARSTQRDTVGRGGR